MTSEAFNILLGSAISLMASCLVTILQNRHNRKLAEQNNAYENQKWIRNKKADVYVLLAGLLDDIAIFVNAETGMVDGKSFADSLETLVTAMEEHQGEIALFVPPSINAEMMKLRTELYELSSDAQAQKIDWSDFKSSKAMETIIHAKSIFTLMARDLGIEHNEKK